MTLSDFFRGNTKRWRVTFASDITGAVITFRMARSLSQAAPDLEVVAVLDGPDGQGQILGATLEISAVASALLAGGDYFAEHEITTATGEVTTFLSQTIKVRAGVPKA